MFASLAGQVISAEEAVTSIPLVAFLGSAVYIRLRHSGATFQSKAMITYSLPGMGMGIAFSNIAEDQIAIVSKWIAEISGESVADPQIESKEIGSNLGLEHQTPTDSPSEWREAMAELIGLLTKKQVLTEEEAEQSCAENSRLRSPHVTSASGRFRKLTCPP